MDIIFQYEDKKIKLPVNPESLRKSTSSSAQKVKVVGIGEVSIPQSASLATISIKSFFWKYLFDTSFNRVIGLFNNQSSEGISNNRVSGVVTNTIQSVNNKTSGSLLDDSTKFKTLTEYVKWFEDWRDSKKPARFTVVTLPNEPAEYFDLDVTCERFDYEAKAGEEGDYYYEMELLEYRHYEAKELNTKTDSTTGKTVAETPQKSRLQTFKEKVKEIRVKPVDTVWTIAKKYGSGEYDSWKQLYNIGYNRNIIANNLKDLGNKTLQMPKEWL